MYPFKEIFVDPVKEYFSKLFGPTIDADGPIPLETATKDNSLKEKISSLYSRILTMMYMARK